MRRGAFFWSIVFILAGMLFLLDNLGLVDVNVGGVFWPLLLIAAGLWTLGGVLFRRSYKVERLRVPLEGARQARVRLNHAAGRLDIHSLSNKDTLIEGDFAGGVEFDTRRQGDRLQLCMRSLVQFFPFWGPGISLVWSLGLQRDIPLVLELEMGANEAQVDLSEMKVSLLRLKSGASSTDLTLPADAGFTRVEVSSGAASITIRIPAGVAARTQARSSLSSINVDTTSFPLSGYVYQAPDYETAANKVDLSVEMEVGSLTVG